MVTLTLSLIQEKEEERQNFEQNTSNGVEPIT
jgi:hypothetical protein